MRTGDLHSPAMDVLNSIKVTIPPELREMLLEFVVCYIIDRPSDPLTYAAEHFISQQKLSHSEIVHCETITAPGGKPVEMAVTPEVKEEDFMWDEHVDSEMDLGNKRLVPKMLRIIDDHGRPYSVRVVERVEDIFRPDENFPDTDEVSVDIYEAGVRSRETLDVVEQLPQPEEEDSVVVSETLMEQEEEEEEVEVEQTIDPVERLRERLSLGLRTSAADVATHTVIELVHSTYQTLQDMRFSCYKGHETKEEPEDEENAMTEAQ